MKFAEIPQRLNPLLHTPDSINHTISVEGVEQKQTACYDIDVEVDDTLKTQMNNFLRSTASQQEIQVRYIIFFFLIYFQISNKFIFIAVVIKYKILVDSRVFADLNEIFDISQSLKMHPSKIKLT